MTEDVRARSQHLMSMFAAQVQESMVTALDGLSSDSEDGDSPDGKDGDPTSALQQAGAGALGGAGLVGAGAGGEAAMAQQLLASLAALERGGTVAAASPGSTIGATGSVAASGTVAQNAAHVADVARQQGVDPTVAVAMMLVESGGNARAVGDGGTSFGLFQLHEGGMLTAAGLTPDQAFDPRTNATVALKSLAHEWAKGAKRSPGEIAAASQRPADPVGYARKVDAAMQQARALLA